MQDASATDSGVYECIPDNAPPARVKVHILTAGNPTVIDKINETFSNIHHLKLHYRFCITIDLQLG